MLAEPQYYNSKLARALDLPHPGWYGGGLEMDWIRLMRLTNTIYLVSKINLNMNTATIYQLKIDMPRGKSVPRPIKLDILKRQGMNYNAKDKYFFCNHCEVPIYSPDL